MLFRRRKPADFWEKLRTFLWPRRSFKRSMRYFAKRILRLHATPHAVAAGVAAGVFASFTPFVGFHFMIAAVIAYLIAGNVLASAFGTAIGNPLTFPFIWGATFETGRFVLTGSFVNHNEPIDLKHMLWHMDFSSLWAPVVKPMLFGAIPIGIVFAGGFYLLTRWATLAFREKRRKLLADRARKRARRQARSGGLKDGAAAGS